MVKSSSVPGVTFDPAIGPPLGAVIVESDGARAALLVDRLVGQQQVVVKSLDANFRRVPGIAGATIMGDGKVAMILDTAHIIGNAQGAPARAVA